ncbi:hypothetical protein THTE_4418 [Thermogutta terrifontis]|uniref:Uncharacterized protein n=1 Tax=Thermogutta terrifontis TaxID=1331910 RepID=A0A286RM21_9BACT|nr:hypothetical protein THTE_4418 [Thermogutta terrifontis]
MKKGKLWKVAQSIIKTGDQFTGIAREVENRLTTNPEIAVATRH